MKKTFDYWLRAMSHGRYADSGLLILRFSPGFIMAYAHGWGKLTNFREYAGDFYNFLGLGDSFSLALVVFAEFICSILLVLGLFTRFAIIPLLITMGVIIFDLNAGKEIYEFETPLLYMIIFLTLMITGAGKYSLDYKFFHKPVLNM